MTSNALFLNAYSTVSALGQGRAALRSALLDERSGLTFCDFPGARLNTWLGRVAGVETVQLPDSLASYTCRNHQLALLGLETDGFAEALARARKRYGAARIGVFMGTSTSGLEATENAYRRRSPEGGDLPADFFYRQTHNTGSLAEFVRRCAGLSGPALVISTACSSSAKVFAAASRFLRMGWCDAALVGGVDSLCLTTLYGFNSLELISAEPCRPWNARRDGISIGEAAGFALLEAEGEGVRLLGYGESADAYHMSTPHPDGEGARLAMDAALRSAGLQPGQIDYINLHGTATPANDRAEDRALQRVFPGVPPCSSTKGWTGHSLGAAGITEALICALALEEGFLPMTLNMQTPDSELASAPLRHTQHRRLLTAMSNSFGFGGSNCSLIFGNAD